MAPRTHKTKGNEKSHSVKRTWGVFATPFYLLDKPVESCFWEFNVT